LVLSLPKIVLSLISSTPLDQLAKPGIGDKVPKFLYEAALLEFHKLLF